MANYKKKSGVMLADKMRKAVLQSAIMGKLTEQRADDGNASDLLGEIRAQKERLVAEKVIKREKPLSPISDEEKPFDIPDSWVWVRLGDVISVSSGKGLTSSEMVINGAYPVYGGNGINGYYNEWFVKKDTLVIGRVGYYCGATHKVISDCWVTDNALIVTSLNGIFDNSFLCYLLNFLDLNKTSVSTAQPVISGIRIYPLLIPLPPLAEQKRIVEKLEQIFPELDRLQADEQQIHALQTAFPAKMQASLLQSAISGKLTKQNPETDGNANDLLTQIQAEKQRLIAEKVIKKEKPLLPISDDEKPFDIPDNWVWVRLGDVGSWASGATPSRSESKYYLNGNINWLKTGDLTDGIITQTSEKITQKALEETSVKLQPVGAVLMAMYGATIGKVGLLEIEATTNQACCGCIPFTGILNWYLFYFLIANRQNFIDMGAGGAQPNISKEKIVNALIPLPPLAEQKRIVEKLDQLLPQVQSLNV